MKDFIINNNSFDCDNCTICSCEDGKICENCSKCLGIDGYEARAIKIDQVIEEEKESKFDLGDFSEFDLEDEKEDFEEDNDCINQSEDALPYIDAMEDGNWEYIDDIEGMEEIMHENNSSDVLVEQFPGLYVINKKEK